MFSPFQFKNITLETTTKILLEEVSLTIRPHDFIALLGNNGTGKSTLLTYLQSRLIEQGATVKLVEQSPFVPNQSGGEALMAALERAFLAKPEILLLDEPTNHLDRSNLEKLFFWIDNFSGALIVVTHDVPLINRAREKWIIRKQKIERFREDLETFLTLEREQEGRILAKIQHLKEEIASTHERKMKEEQRAKKRKILGEKKYGNDTIALRAHQGQGERTSNKNQKQLKKTKEELEEKLNNLERPNQVRPRFFLPDKPYPQKTIVRIENGQLLRNRPILEKLNISLNQKEKMAFIGANGSGKSSLLKALLQDSTVQTTGSWVAPCQEEIGFIDQHYKNLDFQLTPLTFLEKKRILPRAEIYRHLDQFGLKGELIQRPISTLSEGEKGCLSLASIALTPPKLLLIDEITNNMDFFSKEQILTILKEYPLAFIIVCHEENFLKNVGIDTFVELAKFQPKA
ncbi:MAG: ATP-binding cassette domain-containing protein [Chlamydiia bacterium]